MSKLEVIETRATREAAEEDIVHRKARLLARAYRIVYLAMREVGFDDKQSLALLMQLSDTRDDLFDGSEE
jgi:hypothetical protein